MGKGYVKGQTKTAHRVRRINELKSSGYVQRGDRMRGQGEAKRGGTRVEGEGEGNRGPPTPLSFVWPMNQKKGQLWSVDSG